MSEILLDNIPVEILHRIFDHLDAHTIIVSIRAISKRYYGVVNSYNRFQLNFDSNKKSFIECMARIIQPSNVTSLILSNEYKITRWCSKWFLKAFDISKFTRVHSLTFNKVNHNEIMKILQNISIDSLISLKIDGFRQYDNNICSIIFRINLRQLYLGDLDYRHHTFPWPIENQLQYLTIRSCTFHGYHIILRNLHYLKTLDITDCIVDDNDEVDPSFTVTKFNSMNTLYTFSASTGI